MDKNDIIEYVMHTPHNTNKAVLSSMLNQLTEGSGDSWTTLTEESVTTEDGDSGLYETSLEYSELITADSVRITLNGVEYTCTNISEESGEGAYGAEIPDWSTYPFRLESSESPLGVVINYIITESAGTYTIKIEVPQSGGSLDFSTAEVTIGGNGVAGLEFPCVGSENDGDYGMCSIVAFESGEGSDTFYIPLYKNQGIIQKVDGSNNISVTGDVVYDSGRLVFLVSGDGTITIDGVDVGGID